jgi:homoserine dehydrogenase
MRALMVGYGGVGKALIKMLKERGDKMGLEVKIEGVVTRRGIMIGISPEFRRDREGGPIEALDVLNPDLVIDVSSANYSTGEPSLSLYKKSLSSGIHVVTTNKAPLALAYPEISRLVGKGRLGFQGTVMSGTPSINLYRIMPGIRVLRVRGILNGTTNFILTKMEEGMSFQEALSEARRMGYAEEDPTLDLNGFDAAAKLAILSNFYMNTGITVHQIRRGGIGEWTPMTRGKRIKLVARADKDGAEVSPIEVGADDPLFHVSGVENALIIEGDIQTVMVRGPGAGPINAAYGAFCDLYLLSRGFL